MNKYIGDASLFMILLSLLFLPVGTFGLAEVRNTEKEVLSIHHVRTERLEAADESTESTESEEKYQVPEEVIPFYR